MLRDVPQERDSLSDTPVLKSGTNRAKGTAEQAPRRATGRATGRAPGSTYWLIARNETSRLEVLATGLVDAEKAMPVFSHEEEAELFLGLWEVGVGGWQARESSAGRLSRCSVGLARAWSGRPWTLCRRCSSRGR